MEYSLDLGAWNQVFAVPTALVDRHLKLAGKEQLQAILWILRHAGEHFTKEMLADALDISTDNALDALEYWQNMGLLAGRGGDLHPLPQEDTETAEPTAANVPVKPVVESAPIAPEVTPAQQEPVKLPRKHRFEKPDMAYLVKRREDSEAIQYLLQEAESILGLLSPAMSSVLVASVDDYGLPAEVVMMLVNYAVSIGKTDARYLNAVAQDWAESSIFTLEAAEEKLQELSDKRLAWSKVSSVAGLQKRVPTKKEEENAYRWVCEWKFSTDMIAAAYERCVDNTGKFSAAYINKVLERWHRMGFATVEAVEENERKNAAAKLQQKSSYDINELERRSFSNIPEDLLQ